MTHPPDPNAWRPATLQLAAAADGHHGTLVLDGVPIHVRRWAKVGAEVTFECQHATDGWVDREFPR